MPAFRDAVSDTTTTTGTGTLTLAGATAIAGTRTISAAHSNADTLYYRVENSDNTEWEVGLGTYTSSGTTLSRDTVLASSNSGSAVNFSAGTKNVYTVFAATRMAAIDHVQLDAANATALRTGTSAQTFRVYNTYTDASNYERGFARWNSNVFEVGSEVAGTGTGRTTKLMCSSINPASITLGNGIDFNPANTGTVYRMTNTEFVVGSTVDIRWSVSGVFTSGSYDTEITRIGAAIVGFRGNGASTGCALNLIEQTAPSAPSANQVVIYAEDNGSGKTRLMALFQSGAAQQIAIEP